MKGDLPEGTTFELDGEGCWATIVLKERRLVQGHYRKFTEHWYWKAGNKDGGYLHEGNAPSLVVAKEEAHEDFNIAVCGKLRGLTKDELYSRLKKIKWRMR